MIRRLNHKDSLSFLDFILRVKDLYEDFYITQERNRIFFKDLYTIKKLLDKQEVYGFFEEELKGILIIYREKGFRTYIKILTENRNIENKFIKFLMWNFTDIDLYAKLKKNNSLSKYLQLINRATQKPLFGFVTLGSRGDEILLYRKGEKRPFRNNIGEKDGDNDNN